LLTTLILPIVANYTGDGLRVKFQQWRGRDREPVSRAELETALREVRALPNWETPSEPAIALASERVASTLGEFGWPEDLATRDADVVVRQVIESLRLIHNPEAGHVLAGQGPCLMIIGWVVNKPHWQATGPSWTASCGVSTPAWRAGLGGSSNGSGRSKGQTMVERAHPKTARDVRPLGLDDRVLTDQMRRAE